MKNIYDTPQLFHQLYFQTAVFINLSTHLHW